MLLARVLCCLHFLSIFIFMFGHRRALIEVTRQMTTWQYQYQSYILTKLQRIEIFTFQGK